MKYLTTAVSAAVLALACAPAMATDFKDWVPAQTTATTAGSTDYVPLVQSGATKKLPGDFYVKSGSLASGIAAWLATPSGANLATALTSALPISKGGTGQAAAGGAMIDALSGWSFTGMVKRTGAGAYSGAVAGTDYAAAPSGSANTPLFNNGAGGFTNGTRSGNTTALVTKDASSPAANDCAKWDASGNLTTAGAACGAGGGSPTVTDGTTSVTASTVSFDPVSFDVVDSGGGTATIKPITTVNAQSGTSYTVVLGDANKTIRTSNASAVTLNLTAAATLGSGFGAYIECDGAAGCTIDPNGAETIDGAATLALPQYGKAYIQTDGTGWRGAVMSPVSPRNASNLNSGTVAEARGGAGAVSGIMKANGSGVVSQAVAGTDYIAPGGNAGTPSAIDLTNSTNDASLPAIGWISGAVPSVGTIFTVPAGKTATVTQLIGTVETAVGGTATISFYKTASGTACASGTIQHSGSFNANGTANTNQTLTLAGGAANTFAAGDRLCFAVSGAGWTSSHTGNGAITARVRM